uniref:Glycosyltransferase family 92 protein n=1 Tax=Lygus hesperus TaxID=30085 RepID=A0A0K8SU52_LYGHE
MGRVSGRVLRERANMSFCIVIIFFAVFFIIVLTEIFLIDQNSRNRNRRQHARQRSNYEDTVIISRHGEDYLVYQGPEDGKNQFGRVPQYILPNQLAVFKPNTNITIPAKDGFWQSVAGTRFKFFVFSAYYDGRGARMVRVMGATKTRGPDRVWCVLWYQSFNSTTTLTVPAKVKVIRENWNLKYSACFILCPLASNMSVPHSVSIMSRAVLSPSNRLFVNHAFEAAKAHPTPQSSKIGVCVKPLHFNYNQTLQLIEFIELNSLLGMDHITFYNDSISSTTDCVLKHYMSEGRVTVLRWKLDMVSQREIRTEGLFAALNDCLYRSMYDFGYVALIDLDEIVMPKHNDTIQQFIEWMGTRLNTKSTGSYSFQNAFFYLQWPDDLMLSDDVFESSLTSMRKTRRRAKLHPHKQRSKYICRPEFVIEAGNHFVWEFVPGHGTLNVPADAGILNHYRVCEFGGDDCVKSASVIDRTAFRYKDRLVARVKKKWKELQRTCAIGNVEQAQVKKRIIQKLPAAPKSKVR